MGWKSQNLDGALLQFDRDSGRNVLVRSERTAGCVRSAPRVLQIELLTSCNLECSFCYRNPQTQDLLTHPFLLDLLRGADDWGVLEVAFGGGEPLLFDGFVELLEELRATTKIGLNFTTNGTLLTDETVARLQGVVGEVRISAYPDNGYRKTLRRVRHLNPGINLLVTSQNVGTLEAFVHDVLSLGAANVMLLGYKGPNQDLHLDARAFRVLESSVRRMAGLPLRLDVCWYPTLQETQHLFQRSDCGAGDELLAITADRMVQPCSFHHERHPFHDIGDVISIYRELRCRRPSTTVDGCSRPQFSACTSMKPVEHSAAWVWTARAGNNSGDATIVARFCDEDTARLVARSLRELSRAQEAFLASEEGQRWLETEVEYNGSIPSPVLRKYGEAHGFEWSQEGEGLWWEEDGCGAPVLTAGAVGDAVVVYHPYCMGLPEEAFRRYFGVVGAKEFGHWSYDRPRVVVHAQGRNKGVEKQLKEYLKRVQAAEHACDVEEDPPWGREVRDPRVGADEDRSARLADGKSKMVTSGGFLSRGETGLRLVLSFENTFAGTLAIEVWLASSGYKDIRNEVEPCLTKLEQNPQPKTPIMGIFGDVVRDVPPWEQKPLAEATDQQVVQWLFESGEVSQPFIERLQSVKGLIELLESEANRCWSAGEDIVSVVVQVVLWRRLEAAPLARDLWSRARDANVAEPGELIGALAASLPADEALDLAGRWVRDGKDAVDQGQRLSALSGLKDPRVIPFIYEWWSGAGKPADIPANDLGDLAAVSSMSWAQLRDWLTADLPLARIAVRVLRAYSGRGAPEGFEHTDTRTLDKLLADFIGREMDPVALENAEHVRKWPQALVSDAEGI